MIRRKKQLCDKEKNLLLFNLCCKHFVKYLNNLRWTCKKGKEKKKSEKYKEKMSPTVKTWKKAAGIDCFFGPASNMENMSANTKYK